MENGKFDENSSELQDLPNYIWHFRLVARIASSQLAEGGIETSKCHHRKSKGSCTTDVRSADLKATSRRKRAAARS